MQYILLPIVYLQYHSSIFKYMKNISVLKCLINSCNNTTSPMPSLMSGLRTFCVFRSFNFAFKRHSSSSRWQTRQLRDRYTREAAVQGLKSRAAFKLLQVILPMYITHSPVRNCADKFFHLRHKINEKYRIFRSGQTIVDLVGHARKLFLFPLLMPYSKYRAMLLVLGPKCVHESSYTSPFFIFFLFFF